MKTLTLLQETIASIYEGKQDAPTTTSKKWGVRTNLINAALRRWERTESYVWEELWTTLDDAADGDKTLVTAQKTYDAPTNYWRAGGFVEFWDGTDKMQRIKVLKAGQIQNRSDQSQYAYFTGDPNSGYTLNLTVAPVAAQNGYTIKYPYYKHATEYSAETDISEIPDSDYLVYYAVAELYKSDQLQANASRYDRMARDVLLHLEQRQFAETEFQDSIFESQNSAGFGV